MGRLLVVLSVALVVLVPSQAFAYTDEGRSAYESDGMAPIVDSGISCIPFTVSQRSFSVSTNNYQATLYGSSIRYVKAEATSAPVAVLFDAYIQYYARVNSGTWYPKPYDSGYPGEPIPRAVYQLSVPPKGTTQASVAVHVRSVWANDGTTARGYTLCEYLTGDGEKARYSNATTGTPTAAPWSVAGLPLILSTSATSGTITGTYRIVGHRGETRDAAVVARILSGEQPVAASRYSIETTTFGQVDAPIGLGAPGETGAVVSWLEALLQPLRDFLEGLIGLE